MDKITYKQQNQRIRKDEYQEKRLKLDKYKLSMHGLLNAKPPCSYKRILARYPNQVLFGIELEIESAHNYAKSTEALKHIGEHYCCTDGSLNSSGLEIVIGPRPTFDYSAIRLMLTGLQKAGCLSHESGNCGLHIHVGYSLGFSLDDAYRIRSFTTKNSKLFKALSRRTTHSTRARRSPFHYCQFKNDNYDRYRAVNITYKTCEFRFFRGTLNVQSFLASLECIESLVAYAMSTKELNLKGYKNYIKANAFHYLRKYMEKVAPTAGIRRLTEEEKQQRKLNAERKKQNYFRMINAVISDLEHYPRTINSMGTARMPTGLPLYSSELPITFRGTWNRRYIEQYQKTVKRVPVLVNAASISLDSRINLHRSCGWGSTRVWASVN